MVDKILSAVSPIALVEKLNEIIDELKKVGGSYLLHHEWADAIVNDLNWLRADTFSWQDGTVYTDAYNHLVADNSGGTSQTETIGSYTITYVLATDGHKITTDETTVANIYNESGVAWYYILDTTNQRFKLPRTKYGFTGLRDTVGKYVAESLPNFVAGNFLHSDDADGTISGACEYTRTAQNETARFPGTNRSYETQGVKIDASISSSTYQDNAPVQQRATQMYLYFYVGQYNQSATEQTAGLNSELFNGKVDLDLGNLDATGKKVIDGQWVGLSSGTVASGVSVNGSSNLSYDISSFLPNDGNDYELLVSCLAKTTSTSGDHLPVYVYSDYFASGGQYICFCRVQTRTNSAVFGGGNAIIPVGTERKLYLIRSTNYHGTVDIEIRGYRRIGTNS